MGDLLSEHRITLTELARQECVSVPTTWRWRQKGVRNVYLETFMIGGRRCTTQEAFARFVEATTAAADGPQPSSRPRTNRQREAAIRRAEARLAKAGI